MFLEFLLCFLIILFFSKPFVTINTEINKYKNFIIIADNGWSISSNWQNYKNIIKEISLEAEKKKEIHFYYSSSKEFENLLYLNLITKLLIF